MKRTAPMKPGRPLQRRAPLRATQEARALIVHKPLTRAPTYARCTVAVPVPKLAPVRSEPYARLVAARPCIACGIEGHSQHAHGNYGKGMALKSCDLFSFPLCCARPGVPGCHAQHDQGGQDRENRRQLEQEWARRTLQAIKAEGCFPRGLPFPEWAE